jgi:hypothetical protein
MTRRAIILFLDGVGLGPADAQTNPFMHAAMPTAQALLGVPHLTLNAAGAVTSRASLLGLDARLGVDGLPQSATGQTAILTGHNAPALLGEHYGPYPSEPLKELLGQASIFKTLLADGQPVAYANAYPTRFLDRLTRGKGRLSANTQAARRAGLKLRTGDDLRQGRALSALLSNEHWPEPHSNLPVITPYRAGENLAALAGEHTLTFFEFWYSDIVGHKGNREESLKVLGMLDEFLAGITAAMDAQNTLLLVVSDHGNFEDWTTPKHTLNPALTLLAGAEIAAVSARLHSLLDIKPALLSFLLDGNLTGQSV